MMKHGLIVFFLTCRENHEVPTDAHDSRTGGREPHCNPCCGFTVGQNHKGSYNIHNIQI